MYRITLRNTCLVFIVTLLISLVGQLDAQPRFNAELLLGINAAQINGDNIAGYDHMGIMSGVGVSMRYKDNIDFCVDLLYDQRGSSLQFAFNPKPDNTNFFFISLDYVAFPLYIKIKDWLVEYQKSNFNYYRIEFIGGLSFGRAFNLTSFNGVTEFYNQNDLSGIIGVTYRLNRHFGLAFRYTRSMVPLYRWVDANGFSRPVIPHQMSYYITYAF